MDDIVALSLNLLVENDRYLLDNDVNERSITHKLAEYCGLFLSGWDVDCEFNRNLGGPKKIEINPKAFLSQMADFLDEEVERGATGNYFSIRDEGFSINDVEYLRTQLRDPENLLYNEELDLVSFVLERNRGKSLVVPIFPDIIVHRRGTNVNCAVIEVKKTSNHKKKARLFDLVKLNVLTADPKYAYEYAYFIDIPTGSIVGRCEGFTIQEYRFNPTIKIVSPRLR